MADQAEAAGVEGVLRGHVPRGEAFAYRFHSGTSRVDADIVGGTLAVIDQGIRIAGAEREQWAAGEVDQVDTEQQRPARAEIELMDGGAGEP